MQRERVISYVESLANGIDPTSGGRIPLDVFRATEVVQALFSAAKLLREESSPIGSTARPPAAGAPWGADEEARLADEFDSGMPIRDIARQHGRTTGAITSRLVRLGRLDPSAVMTRERGARLAS
jgi:hypothetical protein